MLGALEGTAIYKNRIHWFIRSALKLLFFYLLSSRFNLTSMVAPYQSELVHALDPAYASSNRITAGVQILPVCFSDTFLCIQVLKDSTGERSPAAE